MARGRGARSIPRAVGTNPDGQKKYTIALTVEELQELIRLIDDDEVDEEFLSEIRTKIFRFTRRVQWGELAEQGASAP